MNLLNEEFISNHVVLCESFIMADYTRNFFCLIVNNFLNAFFVAIMLFSSSTNYLPVNCCPLTLEEENQWKKLSEIE
jgi:hypothetical protein